MSIQVKFWNSSTDGAQVGQTLDYSGINLSAGVFALDLAFTADQVAAIFGDGSSPVYIEITSQNITYPRQQYSYVPFALRIPVDSKTLTFGDDGKLTLTVGAKPGANQFLTKDDAGKLTWGAPLAPTIQNQAIATGTPSSGQVLTYNGSQWTSSNPTGGNGNGSGSVANLNSGVTGTLAVMNGGTGVTSFANNGVLIGAGQMAVSTATGSQYQVLTSGAGGALGFGAINLAQSAAVSGVLPTTNGGTGVNSTATFPASGVVVTRDATETLTNKTITTATVNGNSTISGSTEINTTGTINSGAATVSGNVTVRGNGTSANKLILNDKGSTNSVSFKAPDTLASSVTWELPAADGSVGQVLATNGAGTLSWTSGLAPTGAAGGDLTGSFPNPILVNVGTAGAYSKVVVDSKGRVTSGSSLAASDIPNLSAAQITSGTLSSAQLPTAGYTGTYSKVTTDDYGRVTAGSTLSASDIPPISASLITSGTLNTAQLPTTGTAGTYAKVTTDAYGRVTSGTTLATSDITSSLGFTPINKAGDTMSGALNLGSNDVLSTGNIQMAASKTLALSGNTADPTGLVTGDKGKTWFNSTTNQIKYWDGSTAVALGVAGSGLSSFNGQTGNTQTLAVPGTSGTAPTWSSAANAHTLNIPLASTASVTAGLISNSDYNTFNGKVAGVTSGTGVSVSTTGNIATVNLATAGTAGTYAKVTTDAYGRVSGGTTLVAADLPPHSAALITSGTLSVASGGTGVTSTPANGQVLIGNGTNYSLSTLTAGSGVSINNASGAITISTSGVGSVTSVSSGAGLAGGPITTAGTLSLATAGTAGTYAKVTTDAYGRVFAGTTLLAADLPPHSAALLTSGILNTAQLPTAGTAGTYAKVTTDAYGRVTAGTTLASSDVTSSLGFTPINKAGDTMTGALNHGGTDIVNAGNIQMTASKTFALSGNTADPTGLVSGDKGKTWYNSTTNQIKYWDGSAAVALGVAGSGLSSFNGQTGNTQTLATPGTTGTAPTWSSAANAHTLSIPLASTASVTAGLISNTDYNTFNGKVAGVTSGTGVTVSTTGNIATVNLAAAGTAGTYAKVTTDAYGRVSAGTTLVAADLPPHSAALLTSGTLSVANGGTGVTSTPTNGQVLIGNGTNYSLSTLTAGSGVSISNASGAITISTAGAGSVTSVAAGTGLTGGPITSSGTLGLATVGTAGTYAKVTTDAYGRVFAGTTLLAADLPPHSAALLTSGILNTAQLPTAGTAGTYAKVTTDAYGRVTAGTTLASSDVMSSLGFTPINKAGDTMNGSLVLPANGLTVGTNQIVLANGNVGIGTTSPTNLLTVAGKIQSTTGGIVFPDGTTQTSAAITSGTNNTMVTNFPDFIICTIGSQTAILPIQWTGVSGQYTYYQMMAYGPTLYQVAFNANGTYYSNYNGPTGCDNKTISQLYAAGQAFNIAKGPSAQWLQSGANAYYNAGNVGIGTTAPNYRLHNVGTFLTQGSDFELDDGGVNDSTGVRLFSNSGNLYLQNGAGNNIYFRNKTAIATMTIQNGGNVGIGTTAPTAALDVGTGAVAMGWEVISNTCNNVAAGGSCNATCTGTKKATGGSCACPSAWMPQHSYAAPNYYTCYCQNASNIVVSVYCANIR